MNNTRPKRPQERQRIQLKIVPDFCNECKMPLIKEWLRESHLKPLTVQQKEALASTRNEKTRPSKNADALNL